MNREIEFRGQRSDNGEWVTGDLVTVRSKTGKLQFFIAGNGAPLRVRSETVGQFTGLLDRKGKKVFQGDVVGRSVHPLAFEWAEVFVVVWAEFGWMKQIGHHLRITRAFDWYNPAVHTVLGNVYDNPELLEQTR